MNARTTGKGFSMPELLVASALGMLISAGMIELVGLLWQNSLSLRERIHVQQQGNTALQLLRSALRKTGSGLCSPGTSIPVVYQSHAPNRMWLARGVSERASPVLEHSTRNRTLLLDSAQHFEVGALVLLSDERCSQASLAHLHARTGTTYHYRLTDGLWYKAHPQYLGELAYDNLHVRRIFPWLVEIYSLVESQDEGSALYRKRVRLARDLTSTGRGEKLLDDIHRLSVDYGVDLDEPADDTPNQYMPGARVQSYSAWHRVRSLNIRLDVGAPGAVQPGRHDARHGVRSTFWLQHAF